MPRILSGDAGTDAELRELEEQKAPRLVAEMLGKLDWTEAELKRRRRADAKKTRMAAQLRAETTMLGLG